MANNTNTPSIEHDNGGLPTQDAGVVSLKEDVKGLGSDAKAIASDLAEEAKKVATARLDSGKGAVVDGMRPVAEALRSSGEQLQGSPVSAMSSYVGSAADMVEGASRYLEDKSVGEVVGDVESFARREPLIFLGGTFAVGFMLGRFLKASSPGSAETRAGQGQRSASGSNGRRSSASSAPRGQRPALRQEATGLDRLAPSAPSSLGQAPAPAGQGPARITSLGAGAPISSPGSTLSKGTGTVDPLEAGATSVKKPVV